MAGNVPWEIDDTVPAEGSGITPSLLDAVKYVESRGNPKAVSPKGALGAYQFMPPTAKQYGLSDPTHEPSARDAAARYLSDLEKRFGDADTALLAYNWGPGNVARWKEKGGPMPPEAQQYVGKVREAEKKLGGVKQSEAVPWEIDDTVPGYKPTAPKTVGLQKSTARKAADMALADSPWYERALIGAGKSVADVGRAIGIGPADAPEADAALTEDTAGMLGNVGGDIAMSALPGTLAFKGATTIPKLAKMAGNTGRLARATVGGAAAGAAGEATLNRDPITGAEIGAAFGPALIGASKLLNAGAKQAQRFKAGAEGRAVEKTRSALGDRLPTALQQLDDTAVPLVPGEMPTAGRAATPELPELAVWENQARGRPLARLFNQADEASANARSKVLEDIESPGVRPIDPATGRALPSATEELRALTAGPEFEKSMGNLVAIPRDLQAALQGSGTLGTVARNVERDFLEAARLARAEGRPPPPAGRGTPDAPMANLSVYQVQKMIQELDAIPPLQRDFNVTNARNQLSKLVRSQSPDYATGVDLWREMSKPQNRADVAKVLRESLESPVDSTTQRATVFANALRNAPGVIRKADLSPRFGSLEEVFVGAPNELQGIRNVEASLNREHITSNMAKKNEIVPPFLSPAESTEQMMPHFMRQWATVARSVLKSIGRMSDKKVNAVIDQAMTSPQGMAQLLRTLPPTERNQMLTKLRTMGMNQDIEAALVAPATGQIRKAE